MTIKSADRTLEILELVGKTQPTSARDIRLQMDLPRSSLHGLLGVLVEHGFLATNASGEYVVGLKAFEVGSSWLRSVSIEAAAGQPLRDLVDEMKQIAHVGVLDDTDVIYIMKQENQRPLRLVSAVGKRLPAHATALGKVLMSDLTVDDIRGRYGSEDLPRLTSTTIQTVNGLVAAVLEVGHAGYAVDRGESTPGVTCFAAPIRDFQGVLVAAISISVIDADPMIRPEQDYANAVVAAAARVSALLGAREGTFA